MIYHRCSRRTGSFVDKLILKMGVAASCRKTNSPLQQAHGTSISRLVESNQPSIPIRDRFFEDKSQESRIPESYSSPVVGKKGVPSYTSDIGSSSSFDDKSKVK